MNEKERAKFVNEVFEAIKVELPRLIKEERQSMLWNEICKEMDKIEKELDIEYEGYGFIPVVSRIRRIHYEIKIRRRRL